MKGWKEVIDWKPIYAWFLTNVSEGFCCCFFKHEYWPGVTTCAFFSFLRESEIWLLINIRSSSINIKASDFKILTIKQTAGQTCPCTRLSPATAGLIWLKGSLRQKLAKQACHWPEPFKGFSWLVLWCCFQVYPNFFPQMFSFIFWNSWFLPIV